MEEKEINLKEYIKVIVEKKWVVGMVFIISVLATLILGVRSAKTYKARAILEVGRINTMEDGLQNVDVIESYRRMKYLYTNKSIVNSMIRETGGIKGGVSGKINISQEADFLEVEVTGVSPEETKKSADNIAGIIVYKHNSIYGRKKSIQNGEFSKKKKQLKSLVSETGVIDKKIKKIEGTDSQAKAVVLQGYLQTLESMLLRQYVLENDISKLETDMVDYNKTRVVVPAVVAEVPRRLKKKLFISGFLGVFLGIGLVFMMKFVKEL